MNVLVATTETQGQRRNDFCWATPGELVTFGFECDGEAVDGACGCRRAMSGVESHKASTTFKVEDRPDLDATTYHQHILDSLVSGGWGAAEDPQLQAAAKNNADELLRLAAFFGAGTVLEKRGAKIRERTSQNRSK